MSFKYRVEFKSKETKLNQIIQKQEEDLKKLSKELDFYKSRNIELLNKFKSESVAEIENLNRQLLAKERLSNVRNFYLIKKI